MPDMVGFAIALSFRSSLAGSAYLSIARAAAPSMLQSPGIHGRDHALRWQLLRAVDEVVPGERIVGRATTDFPPELYADHFPSFPVTPGVLLIELGAQLSGLLVQATVHERRGHWVFPVLALVRDAKFR